LLISESSKASGIEPIYDREMTWQNQEPRKSFTAKVKELENDRHFWRGVIDGDGSIGIYPRKLSNGGVRYVAWLSLIGSINLVTQFKAFLRCYLQQEVPNIFPAKLNSEVYGISLGDKRAVEAIRLLYDRSSIALERKLERARSILEWHKTQR
jgi:hypothetical protein